MQKSILIAVLCTILLSGCRNTEQSEMNVETTALQTTISETQSAETTTTECVSDVYNPTGTNMEHTDTTAAQESENTTVQIQSAESSSTTVTTTAKSETAESKQDAQLPVSTSTVKQTSVATLAVTAVKTTAATAKKVTTTTTVSTTAAAQPATAQISVTTSTENYYVEIGKTLAHDGTDYGKAQAVYEWMRVNGHGTCVNYSAQTYLVCEGIGLPCYACWTDNQLYGHVANVVQVDGIWFVLDTQAGGFLDYNYGFTEVVDNQEQHIADGSMISMYSYQELFG